jgi:predicted MFS family arabinose efflux permease
MNDISKNLLKCSFIGTFAESMLIPIYALFIEKIGGSILDVGYAFALFNIFKGIFVMTVGRTEFFKKNVHLMVMLGFFVSAVCDCLYLGIHDQYQFFAVQAIAGIALGIINPAWEAIYSDAESIEEASEKWSVWNGGADFATGLAAIIGGLLVAYTSWNVLFVVMGVVSLWSTYYSYLVWKRR